MKKNEQTKTIKKIKFKAEIMAFNGFKKPEMMEKLAKYVSGEISINDIEEIVNAALAPWGGNLI